MKIITFRPRPWYPLWFSTPRGQKAGIPQNLQKIDDLAKRWTHFPPQVENVSMTRVVDIFYIWVLKMSTDSRILGIHRDFAESSRPAGGGPEILDLPPWVRGIQ